MALSTSLVCSLFSSTANSASLKEIVPCYLHDFLPAAPLLVHAQHCSQTDGGETLTGSFLPLPHSFLGGDLLPLAAASSPSPPSMAKVLQLSTGSGCLSRKHPPCVPMERPQPLLTHLPLPYPSTFTPDFSSFQKPV